MLIKNKLTAEQIKLLPELIDTFALESRLRFNTKDVVLNTIRSINNGNDIWSDNVNDTYCLGRSEYDSDGAKVYTAYQLWIDPTVRSLKYVRRIISFLKFYAQKQGYRRLYIPCSRLDSIKAYSRGLGKDFKIKTVIFSKEF